MNINKILTKPLANSTTPRLDLELLLEAILHKPRSFLYANPEYGLTSEQEEAFQVLYARRLRGEPIAYILGKKEFWSLELAVNEKVLIPRPETELLVEIVLRELKQEVADVADLGAGSGAIALALATERPTWKVVATDASEDALQVASYNARQLQVQNVEFYRGSWCVALPDRKFDVIVSNPPYIDENDPHLEQGDVKFEPKTALTSGNGLRDIREIIVQAKGKLKAGGLLVLEHGYDQSGAVQELLRLNNYHQITPYQDLAHIYRAVVATIPLRLESCYKEANKEIDSEFELTTFDGLD